MTAISSKKKVCVRCSVLRLCSKYRRVRELTISARARLACSSAQVNPSFCLELRWMRNSIITVKTSTVLSCSYLERLINSGLVN